MAKTVQGYICLCGQDHDRETPTEWGEVLQHTCEKCGSQNIVKAGKVLGSTRKKTKDCA